MADELPPEGNPPDKDNLTEFERQRAQEHADAADHAYTGDTTHGSFDLILAKHLLEGGHIAGIAAEDAHGLSYHEAEETRKRNDDRTYASRLAAQMANPGSTIADLEERNRQIDAMLQRLYAEWTKLEEEEAALAQQQHTLQDTANHLGAVGAQMQAQLLNANLRKDQLTSQAEEIYQNLSKMGIPKDILRITRFAEDGSCGKFDIEVAVYKEGNRFFYTDPVNGNKIYIIDQNLIDSFNAKLNETDPDKRMRTADQANPWEQKQLASYADAASRLARLTDLLNQEDQRISQYTVEYNRIDESLRRAREQLARNEQRLQEIAAERERLRQEIGGLHNEKRENLELIRLKRREQRIHDESAALREQIAGYEGEREAMGQKIEDSVDQYNLYVQAQIDYDTAFEAMWVGGMFYQNAKNTLKHNDVMMITRDDKDLHLQYAVHRDAKGYFYYNMDGERTTISPKEIARLSGKVVEDFPPDSAVRNADVYLRNSARELGEARALASKAAENLPDGFTSELVVPPHLQDMLYSRSMLAPINEDKAEFDEAEARVNETIVDGKITRGNLEYALFYAPPETRAQILAKLQENNVEIIDGPVTSERPELKPIIIVTAEQRLRDEMNFYQNAYDNIGDDFLSNPLFMDAPGFDSSPKVMLAMDDGSGATSSVAPTIFTGEPGPHQVVDAPDYQNIPRVSNEQMVLATNVTFDGQPSGEPGTTDAFANAAAPADRSATAGNTGLNLNRNNTLTA